MSHHLRRFSQKLLPSKTGKKKQKSSNELLNGHAKTKAKKNAEVIDDNEEILSDSDLDDDEQNDEFGNGNVRLDSLLFNEDDDENNVHEQRLKRAKEYIEQIAKQGETPPAS